MTREAWTTIGARLLVIAAEADLLVEEVEDVEAVPEAIRDRDLHQIDEGMVGAADLHPEGAHGDAPEASVDLVADLPHRAGEDMIGTETGAETTTTTTAEDLLADTVADHAMTTEVAVETMMIGAEMTMGPLEEDPVVAHHPTMIPTMTNMDLPADEVGIRTVHPAEGVAHRQMLVEEVAAIATVGTRAFREYRSWFVTLALISPTTTLARHLDASVTFEMFTSPGITTRSKRKDLLLSNMPILNRLRRHRPKWIASTSRDACLKSYLHRSAARVPMK